MNTRRPTRYRMVAAAVTATMLSAGVLAACGDTSNDTAASDAASDATTTAPADHSTTSDHGYSNGETAGASAQTEPVNSWLPGFYADWMVGLLIQALVGTSAGVGRLVKRSG